MDDAYIGSIVLWAGGWVPVGWMACEGQAIPIDQNQALYAILGNQFGGDYHNTFNLPDLRGRFPLGIIEKSSGSPCGRSVRMGEKGGNITSPITSTAPTAKVAPAAATDTTAVAVSTASATAGNATNTLNPYIGLRYIICVQGLFPPSP